MAPSAIFSRCRHASPPSRLRERVGVRASALALTRSLRDSTSPATRERLASSELQQLDGVVVLHAAADALRRVEQHVGLRRVGIAQDANAGPIDDEIAAASKAIEREFAAMSCMSSASTTEKDISVAGWPAPA